LEAHPKRVPTRKKREKGTERAGTNFTAFASVEGEDTY
jgi:hypothetical protein